jgi:hypothetical protein
MKQLQMQPTPKYINRKTGETWNGHARPPSWIANVKVSCLQHGVQNNLPGLVIRWAPVLVTRDSASTTRREGCR